MDVVAEILEKSANATLNYKPITVNKHLELDYDLGLLLASDSNDLDKHLLGTNKDNYIRDLTRDNVQLLINQIWEQPTENYEDSIVAKLPAPKFILPRSRRVPKPRPPTKWEEFAKAKGIVKKKKSKLTWDEQLKKWIPNYGYRRAQAEKEKDWVLEVPQNANPYEDQFAKKAETKVEQIAKNDFQRMRNIAKARNVKVPRAGLLNTDKLSATDLQTAVTVAKASTSSVGKFQAKLPKEKEAKDVSMLIPGGKRKRKQPPRNTEQELKQNLALFDAILNKRPKINITQAVDRHIHDDASSGERVKSGRVGKKKKGRAGNIAGAPANAKKPKGGKGARKGKLAGTGRKRR